jgi:hypothetical protein
MQTIMTNLVLRGFIIPGLSDAAAPAVGGPKDGDLCAMVQYQGAGTFTRLFPRSWNIHFTFSKELGHSLYFFQGAGTFTLLFLMSWNIHFTFSKELGHSLYFFQGAGTFTLLFPRSWNITLLFTRSGDIHSGFSKEDIHFNSSKELGHSLYFFQGAAL